MTGWGPRERHVESIGHDVAGADGVRVHLVDGTYELFRAHYGRQPDRTAPDGQDVKATVGVISSLLRLLEDPDERVSHIAAAFDNPIESFRNRMFPAYKNGDGIDPALRAQFDQVEEAVAALGIRVWSMDEYEADDALAAGAAQYAGRDGVAQVRILTPDKDLGQCVRGDRIVQVDTMRQRQFDHDGVIERLGVPPLSVPDYLALVGDTADGIPGLKGFGAKSAAVLLEEYGHLEGIPDDVTQWSVRPRGAQRLAQTLAAEREEALLYRTLATLVVDGPVISSLEEIAWGGVPREPFEAWCDAVGVTSLRERVTRWA
ncbi:MAG: 5'-3' exonuclease [Glaciecola sp.]|jgi:5'-3' exonuclease